MRADEATWASPIAGAAAIAAASDRGPRPIDVRCDERTLTLTWDDHRRSTFHYFWLRDNCPQLRHETTNHRVVETSSIPTDVRPATVTLLPDGGVEVQWAHDGHLSTFRPEWLRSFDYSNGVRRRRREPVLWDATIGSAMPRASYPQLLTDDDVKREWMAGFRDYGVGLLHEVPNVPGTVLDVAAVFGEVRVTSWGRLFDVVSLENANSVAYTSLPLVLHTDEGYRDPAPTIQIQHFLVSGTTGGEATLADGFRVAHDMRAEHPEMFELLATVPLYFHFRDDDAEHEHDGTIIETEPNGRLRAINYSNHSVQPFLLDPDLMEPFYEAYRMFGAMREDPTYKLEIPMSAGDIYVVDNHRVMHGRNGFRAGGNRHLQSCYIERDEFMSRLTVLERKAALRAR